MGIEQEERQYSQNLWPFESPIRLNIDFIIEYNLIECLLREGIGLGLDDHEMYESEITSSPYPALNASENEATDNQILTKFHLKCHEQRPVIGDIIFQQTLCIAATNENEKRTHHRIGVVS